MIDDDFESVFRKMMEQFREAFGSLPEGSGTFRSWSGSFVNEPFEQNIEQHEDEQQVEKIDLGDSVLFLIQGHFDSEPEVKVEGDQITVKLGIGIPFIGLEPGFPVDLEKSNASYRNGVIEINVVKAESHQESDGYLKIE
ncbi:MAG: hypothetical protein RTV41_09290 [Candidatus Thorarchaeota archaeon]